MTVGHALAIATLSLGCITSPVEAVERAQRSTGSPSLDGRVETFLESHRGTWRDMNVPEEDGRRLYELILEHGFQSALEIGTSTGHSAVWIAWALSKTGGEFTTIEIDERRHPIAQANFEEAGLADIIDARLGDSHEVVPRLEGPFDSSSPTPTRSGTRGTSSPCGRS
jgi:caffeoyl-CoA O-methyltransferase